jgi:hypothetical protein
MIIVANKIRINTATAIPIMAMGAVRKSIVDTDRSFVSAMKDYNN